jgi:hypothetical protein
MADKLKPCPFCGEQPRTIADDSYGACMVFCIKCDYTPDQCFKKVGELDQAIAVWNTRAAPPPSEAEVEAVARPIYDELEGPINNQSFDRQMKQWERAKVVARAAIAALRAAKEKEHG